ncbi:MAG TPA: AmmeMemoRadiSam system protein A, partial [Bacillota bacterium]|nr:AmmeMemoRadiSam system protein A [Bacillota bacterium]
LKAGTCETIGAEKSSDPYVKLAIETLETYVRTGNKIEIPEDLPEEMLTDRAGVFVSLKKYGELRGCIGTIAPTTINIAAEIIQNAISAGIRDPRFSPVRKEELSDLVYSVDVLGEPEPIESKKELNVKKYGVIVRSGYRTGLLLPNLEGVDTVDYQVSIALQKAGIRSNEPYEMERFEVIRHY